VNWIIQNLWLIPALPLLAAALTAVVRQKRKRFSCGMAIAAMVLTLVFSCGALAAMIRLVDGGGERAVFNLRWFELGEGGVEVGWVLDPVSAVMLVMVSLVGLVIFLYSASYMARDPNFTRFFCFLSLFAAAMLGLVIANSLLLLFICWELVGLTSYLLIGFWYHKPSAAAAAKKAFITTRIGDLALLLGMVWLYAETGTLVFYGDGNGCLESAALAEVSVRTTVMGLAVSSAIALLIFFGAVGKSGQLPLHVWLPDAMEGPTPVSALIHAATMVAAGVFLVARVYPLASAGGETVTLSVVTWVGALTAVFAASIAVAQNDIKRILAYSTVSQLGYMMMGLGVGGVAVGMFHLITHAFFKALLFLGAGSVIHGCHEEQDIRWMGGLRKLMPMTFATYAVGMLALSGFPLLFAGFWSKDAILHAAHAWPSSQGPFILGLVGALLTAFYMTRQVYYVFLGKSRLADGQGGHAPEVHESPRMMRAPLVVLAVFSVLAGFLGTPAWEWFQGFINAGAASFHPGALLSRDVVLLMAVSTAVVLAGMAFGYWLYGRKGTTLGGEVDPLQRLRPDIYWLLEKRVFVDEIYAWSVVRWTAGFSATCDWLDRWIWGGMVQACAYVVVGISWVNRFFEEYVVNGGFNETCRRLVRGGKAFSQLQAGRVQPYLRVIGIAVVVLVILLLLGGRGG
jgi:NADH-quinone oxidoreductase subunit L